MRRAAVLALALLAAAPAAADCRFTLHFPFGSSRISIADGMLLRDVARAHPGGSFALSAHADDDGSRPGNLRVAEARTRAVAARLPRGARVTTRLALAEDWQAVPSNASSVLNRRVELFVAGCDATAFPLARPVDANGLMFRGDGSVRITDPRLPGG